MRWLFAALPLAVTGCRVGFDALGSDAGAGQGSDAVESPAGGVETGTTNGSITITLESGISSEHRVFVAVIAGAAGGAIACTDSRGNTYTIEAQVGAGGEAFVCSTHPSSSFVAGDVITATYPVFDGTSAIAMTSFETQSQKAANVNSGTGTAPTSLSVSAASRDAILGVIAWTGSAQLVTFPAFNVDENVDSQQGAASRHLVLGHHSALAAGSVSADATLSASAPWDAIVAVFPGDN
jgi:hypothetical protein